LCRQACAAARALNFPGTGPKRWSGKAIAPAAVILYEMLAPNSDRIDYWISVAKRQKKFIIAAL